MLQTLQPQGLSTIRDDGWEEVEIAVGAGASETVINEEMVMSAELREGPTSRRGVEYQVANGEKIPNLGEKRLVIGPKKVSIATSRHSCALRAKHSSV